MDNRRQGGDVLQSNQIVVTAFVTILRHTIVRAAMRDTSEARSTAPPFAIHVPDRRVMLSR